MVQFTEFLKKSGFRNKNRGNTVSPCQCFRSGGFLGEVIDLFLRFFLWPCSNFYHFLEIGFGWRKSIPLQKLLSPSPFCLLLGNLLELVVHEYSMTHTVQVEEDHDWVPVSQDSRTGYLMLGTYLTSLNITFLTCNKSKSVLMVLEFCAVWILLHISLSDPKCVLRIHFRENQLPRFPPSKTKNGGSPLPLLWLTYVFTEPNGFALNQNITSHTFPEKIVYTVECSLDRWRSKNTNHTLNFKSIAKLIIFSTRAKENFPFSAIYSEAVYQNDKETILEQIGPHKIDVCWRLCSDFDVLQGKAVASVSGPGQVQGELEGSISWASHSFIHPHFFEHWLSIRALIAIIIMIITKRGFLL